VLQVSMGRREPQDLLDRQELQGPLDRTELMEHQEWLDRVEPQVLWDLQGRLG